MFDPDNVYMYDIITFWVRINDTWYDTKYVSTDTWTMIWYDKVDWRDPSPVDRLVIPLFVGFQHISTIQDGPRLLPSTVWYNMIFHDI